MGLTTKPKGEVKEIPIAPLFVKKRDRKTNVKIIEKETKKESETAKTPKDKKGGV